MSKIDELRHRALLIATEHGQAVPTDDITLYPERGCITPLAGRISRNSVDKGEHATCHHLTEHHPKRGRCRGRVVFQHRATDGKITHEEETRCPCPGFQPQWSRVQGFALPEDLANADEKKIRAFLEVALECNDADHPVPKAICEEVRAYLAGVDFEPSLHVQHGGWLTDDEIEEIRTAPPAEAPSA